MKGCKVSVLSRLYVMGYCCGVVRYRIIDDNKLVAAAIVAFNYLLFAAHNCFLNFCYNVYSTTEI